MASKNDGIIAKAFTSRGTYATVLVSIVVDHYGTECFSWSPETLLLEINEDFDIKIPGGNADRLLCGINLITSDDFYKSLPDFITYCNILSGDTYDPQNWDPADAAEIAWGMTEALLLSPPDDTDEEPFTDEIVSYIGEMLNQEGIINPPDILKIAVRDNDPSIFVADQFSDDPEMFTAIYDFEAEKTEEINNIVKVGLQNLATQLEAVPLRNGSTKGVVQQMFQSLERDTETGIL